jgi:predicted N-acetyltransferase YhbS
MEVRAARRRERDEVLDLLSLWYNDREFFALYNQNDRKFRDELCLVARDRGQLVATVQIFDRAINLAGHRTPMGGIGSVFTREDYRHKGVASDLMRLAIEAMEREGFEVSLLFAERLGFYNRFGWREVARKFTILTGAAGIRVDDDCEIDVFDAARDLSAIRAIHDAYTGRFNVAAIRDEEDWRGNLIFAANQPNRPSSNEYFILARKDDAPVAYLRVSRFHGVAMVMEYGYRPGAVDALLTLFRHLGETAAASPCSHRLRGDHRRGALLGEESGAAPAGVLITHTAHDKQFESRLAQAGCPVNYHQDNNYMWRVISPERLGRRLGLPPDRAAAAAFEMFRDDRSLFWTADRF